MTLTVEQALALAPDTSSAAAGRKLGSPKNWRTLGRSADALWGECQGSALYQVRVDLGDLATKCSCPSRKFPCKHALGLLVLAATDPGTLPGAEPPEWVLDWLQRRAASAKGEQANGRTGERASEPTGEQATEAAPRQHQEDSRQRRQHRLLWLAARLSGPVSGQGAGGDSRRCPQGFRPPGPSRKPHHGDGGG